MTMHSSLIASVAMLSLLPACSRRDEVAKPADGAAAQDSSRLVNRVWRVARSTGVARGDLVVFLSEGTLVFASPNGRSTLGKWTWKGGSLTMIEEGIPYKTEILKLNTRELRIRSHNPGEPVETRFVLAERR
jgi:hypothetical protein